MNSKRKGSIAVGAAIAHFVRNELSVLIPISDCDKYDLAIDQQGVIKRIQCKYSSAKEPSGGYIVDLRTFGGYRNRTYHSHYLQEDFDYLFVYCSNGDKYLIPMEKIIGKSHIVIGINNWNEYTC